MNNNNNLQNLFIQRGNQTNNTKPASPKKANQEISQKPTLPVQDLLGDFAYAYEKDKSKLKKNLKNLFADRDFYSWPAVQSDGTATLKGEPKRSLGNIKIDTEKISSMTKTQISGYDIMFPFEPYQIQKDFIENLLRTLDRKTNGLQQSPTGTGKTLSLLTGCLAWLNKKRQLGEFKSTSIIYMSRTHTQIKQLIKELKSTCYKPKVCIFGSRDQMCVNLALSGKTGVEKNLGCQNLQNDNACNYFKNLEKSKKRIAEEYREAIQDIEELANEGSKNYFCPYFLSKSFAPQADIIFMPYNYITDQNFRHLVKKEMKNAILIFDEAHNLESFASEGSSFTFGTNDQQKCQEEFNELLKGQKRGTGDQDKEVLKKEIEIEDILHPVQNLKANLVKESENRWASNSSAILQQNSYTDILEIEESGEWIFNIFSKFTEKPKDLKNFQMGLVQADANQSYKKNFENGLTTTNFSKYLKLMEDVIEIFKNKDPKHFFTKSVHIEKWTKICVQVEAYLENFGQNKSWEDTIINHFRTFFIGSNSDHKNCKINLCCQDPGITFKEITAEEPHNIILTSGTLTPFETYDAEYKIPFETKFSCEHVINTEKQLFSGIVSSQSPNNRLNFSYQRRSDENMMAGFGRGLVQLCRIIPKGVLVFFSSYSVMNSYIKFWSKSSLDGNNRNGATIQKSQEDCKAICTESQNKKQFQSAMKKFGENYSSKGAIFFGVCGGKLSEGIDFSDDMARAVQLVGIPYPNYMDVRVTAKRAYLDRFIRNSNSRSGLKYNGQQWYQIKAIRATNQAIGRVIRHRHDFGCVLLCDERFNETGNLSSISSWAKKQIQKIDNQSDMLTPFKNFFEEAPKYISQVGGVAKKTGGFEFYKAIEGMEDFKGNLNKFQGELNEKNGEENKGNWRTYKRAGDRQSLFNQNYGNKAANDKKIQENNYEQNKAFGGFQNLMTSSGENGLNRLSDNSDIFTGRCKEPKKTSLGVDASMYDYNSKSIPCKALTMGFNMGDEEKVSKIIEQKCDFKESFMMNYADKNDKFKNKKKDEIEQNDLGIFDQKNQKGADLFGQKLPEKDNTLSFGDIITANSKNTNNKGEGQLERLLNKTNPQGRQNCEKNQTTGKNKIIEEEVDLDNKRANMFEGLQKKKEENVKLDIMKEEFKQKLNGFGLMNNPKAKTNNSEILTRAIGTGHDFLNQIKEDKGGTSFIPKVREMRDANNKLFLNDNIPKTNDQEQDMKIECVICYEIKGNNNNQKVYKASLCGHICCDPCWGNWLSEKLECPVCHKRTRDKNLITLE